MSKFFKLYHNNSMIKTLAEIAAFYGIIFEKKDKNHPNPFTLSKLFNQNRKTIFRQLRNADRQALCKRYKKTADKLTAADLYVDMTLPCPCYLYIDKRHITYAISADHSNFQAQTTNVLAFENEQIQQILSEAIESQMKNTKRFKPGVRVFGWFKSRYYMETLLKDRNLDLSDIYSNNNDFIDISPFITSLSTQVGGNGGNFSLSLPHVPIYTGNNTNDAVIVGERGNEENKLDLNAHTTQGVKYDKLKEIAERYINASDINEYRVSSKDKNLYVKSDTWVQDYFEWLIQPNDLLFIAFDDMNELEDTDSKNNALAGRNFDMIALVDSVSLSRTSDAAINVNVSGRDLMKLLQDDNRLYFPNSVSKGNYNIWDNNVGGRPLSGDLAGTTYINGQLNERLQNLPNGSLDIFNDAAVNGYTISFVLKTIISHCANISITPDNLFNAWGNKRTKFSDIRPHVKKK